MQSACSAVIQTDIFYEENIWMTRPKDKSDQETFPDILNSGHQKPFNSYVAAAEFEIGKIAWTKAAYINNKQHQL